MPAYKDSRQGTWYASFYFENWQGVKQKKLKRGFATKKDALAWEREFLLQQAADLTMTFEAFVEIYITDKKKRLRENTWSVKEHIIRTKILPYFKEKRLSEIKPRDVIAWQNEMLNYRDKNGKAYSPTYLKTLHGQLSAILNHAVRFYGLKSNAAATAGCMGSEKHKEMLFWTKEEYLKFAEAMMDKPQSYYAFEVLYWCGIREGELLALTPADFDLDKGLLSITKSYAHTKQAVVMDILRREIPSATWLLAVINCLLAMAPGEGLLIGGYLEAWLFNLVASYMLVKVLSYAKTRRGASTPFVTRSGSYMDDLVLLGRRWADIQSAARKLTKWALAEFGLTIKTEWVRVDFLSAAEEHQRRHMTGAAKGCPGLDMAGYVMHRTYTTIRPRIFLRARRQYIRAKADVSRNGYVPVWRSYKLVSYNGYFDWTKSRAISEALKQKKLFTAAKVAIRVTAQRNAMKKVRIAA